MSLKSINIKGKQYVTVHERLKAFRDVCEEYTLESELVDVNDRTALIRAVIKDPKGRIIATGTAFERADQKGSLVNSTSHVENCETSAWGRALGNFGIGIDDSVATADEVQNSARKPAFSPAETAPAASKPTASKVMEYLTACKTEAQVEVVWKSAMNHKWGEQETIDLNECKANVLTRICLPV